MTPYTYLRHLCHEGLAGRYPEYIEASFTEDFLKRIWKNVLNMN